MKRKPSAKPVLVLGDFYRLILGQPFSVTRPKVSA